MADKKKEELVFGEGSNNAIIFGMASGKLTEEQLNQKIQLEARKASGGSNHSGQSMAGSMRAAMYRRK